jgi:hypothetical protein
MTYREVCIGPDDPSRVLDVFLLLFLDLWSICSVVSYSHIIFYFFTT